MPRMITFASLVLVACGGGPSAGLPTWDEAAPLIEANCTGCHNPDGAATFSLTTYAEAQPWAAAIGEAVGNRTMPPWLVTDDGTCGDFLDSRWLDDAEVETLVAWGEAGGPEGKEDSPLVIQAPPELARVDAELITPEIIPEREGEIFAEYDEYRCFLMDNPEGKDIYLTGYDVQPGNKAIVHHVLGMPIDPTASSRAGTTNAEEIALMDGADGRPGWDCLGTAGGNLVERGIPISWAPGQGRVDFPDGLGVWIGAHEQIIVQIHYNLVDLMTLGQPDSTSLRLRYEAQVDTVAHVALPDPFLESLFQGAGVESLPAGDEAYKYVWELSAREVLWRTNSLNANDYDSFKLWAVLPHMHRRGRKMSLKILRGDGPKTCAADVDDWDFDWQLVYFYDAPIEVAADDVFRVSCTFDTSDATSDVLPGWGTQYEMCLMGVIVSVD
jgi:hypothetical protein